MTSCRGCCRKRSLARPLETRMLRIKHVQQPDIQTVPLLEAPRNIVLLVEDVGVPQLLDVEGVARLLGAGVVALQPVEAEDALRILGRGWSPRSPWRLRASRGRC